MSFDRTPCRAGLLVTSVVITIPFLITYLIHDGPFQLLQRRCLCPLTWRQAGSLPLLPRALRPLFPLLRFFPSFPVFSLSPFSGFWARPRLRWIVTPLIFWPLLWRAKRQGYWSSSLHAACPSLTAACLHLGEGSSLPRLQPALSQVEKNSEGNIIFKSLNVLSGCFGNLTSGKRSLVQAWWLMWHHLLLITKRLKTQPGYIFACHWRICSFNCLSFNIWFCLGSPLELLCFVLYHVTVFDWLN